MAVHASWVEGPFTHYLFKGRPYQRHELSIKAIDAKTCSVSLESEGEWVLSEKPTGKLEVEITGRSVEYLFEALAQIPFVRRCIREEFLPDIDERLKVRKR